MKRVGYFAVWTAALLFTSFGVATAQTQAAHSRARYAAVRDDGFWQWDADDGWSRS